ncbi:TadE/TadG family type IV pilus assembly protein [Ponticaulis sp.]|uniref:TadE/TadG family type IV pilus assembly protein n=1 Tax=Ponticaulis sp. TaxID=2020902 RepID=UPI000B69BCA3|nr:TadE/TadG family type IV pilus assembly protein [Ponticaulis sp.]MAI90131.1 hypothetical protein [Ponticaulis sp.]OUX99785.1 MAG: hypothetical protein CBB65_06800 [Hyphomonadaceae bacterium TMED5]|tara:strand:+ start:90195 stop:90620 length:426 start_codon:yes stop_codon:yes gene_type:complete
MNMPVQGAVRRLRAFKSDKKGVSAIEFAFVFPILVSFVLSLFYIGVGFFGVQQAQNTTERVARIAYMLDEPSASEIRDLVLNHLGTTLAGTFTPNVQLTEKYGETYADISIDYAYSPDIPFLPEQNYVFTASSEVLIRDIP